MGTAHSQIYGKYCLWDPLLHIGDVPRQSCILKCLDKFGSLHIRPWAPLKKWPSHTTHGGFALEQTKLEKLCKKRLVFVGAHNWWIEGESGKRSYFVEIVSAPKPDLSSVPDHDLQLPIWISEKCNPHCTAITFITFYIVYHIRPSSPGNRNSSFCGSEWYSECCHPFNVAQYMLITCQPS